ncbi:hypothetical protein ACWD4G_20000 [Streptomyces sp. NPDC002643]
MRQTLISCSRWSRPSTCTRPLCRALDGHPPPRDAPDCRAAVAVAATDAVDAAGALSAKVAEANRRSREAL